MWKSMRKYEFVDTLEETYKKNALWRDQLQCRFCVWSDELIMKKVQVKKWCWKWEALVIRNCCAIVLWTEKSNKNKNWKSIEFKKVFITKRTLKGLLKMSKFVVVLLCTINCMIAFADDTDYNNVNQDGSYSFGWVIFFPFNKKFGINHWNYLIKINRNI